MGRFDGAYVLAGFDGSAAGERALRWAVEEARLRRMPLVVCHAWHWPYPVPPSGPSALETVQKMARHVLDRGMLIAREAGPRIPASGRLVSGPAPAMLVNQSKDAALAVVGTHGEGSGAETSAGSSALQLPAYAHCPVMVVRNAADRGRPIVVGVDGSAASDAALAFGFEEAALRGQPLRAVLGCWEPDVIASAEMGMIRDPDEVRMMAASRLERTVSPWREQYPYVDAETVLLMRTPRHALLEAAARAALLVLGGRGLGGVTGLRLGAVSSAMLQHAPCSVAIVRPRG
ncbi:universal stress protein [Actinomadura sp. DC4]|uniref:universal stress protein n=1 Tax=Actinomadura sp. DC4 TaxID=3055069 RepID=UPI0025B09068|nr:universal stress protein [Actinomadura sp. DC4]MDN3358267.1 universal stress protein [Actinomadura sp. DC4]